MDDIIPYSNSVEDHISHVDEILPTITEALVTLEVNKFTFFSNKVEYIRRVIRLCKLEVNNTHTASLKKAKPPTTKSDILWFLWFRNF